MTATQRQDPTITTIRTSKDLPPRNTARLAPSDPLETPSPLNTALLTPGIALRLNMALPTQEQPVFQLNMVLPTLKLAPGRNMPHLQPGSVSHRHTAHQETSQRVLRIIEGLALEVVSLKNMEHLMLAVDLLGNTAPLMLEMDFPKNMAFLMLEVEYLKNMELPTLALDFPKSMEYQAPETVSPKSTGHQLNVPYPKSMEPLNWHPGLCLLNTEYPIPGLRLLKNTGLQLLLEVALPSPALSLSVLPVQSHLSVAPRPKVTLLLGLSSSLNRSHRIMLPLPPGQTSYLSHILLLNHQPKALLDPEACLQHIQSQRTRLNLTTHLLGHCQPPTECLQQGILIPIPRIITPLLNPMECRLQGTCQIPMECPVQGICLRSMVYHPAVLIWKRML